MSISEVRTYDVGDCKYYVISVQVVLVAYITNTLGNMFLFLFVYSSVFLFPAEIKYSVESAKMGHHVKWSR